MEMADLFLLHGEGDGGDDFAGVAAEGRHNEGDVEGRYREVLGIVLVCDSAQSVAHRITENRHHCYS